MMSGQNEAVGHNFKMFNFLIQRRLMTEPKAIWPVLYSFTVVFSLCFLNSLIEEDSYEFSFFFLVGRGGG